MYSGKWFDLYWKTCNRSFHTLATCSFSRMKQTEHAGLLQKNQKNLARSFDFTFRCIYDVLSRNNSKSGDYLDLIYLIEPEIKNNTDTTEPVSNFDLHLEIAQWRPVENKTSTKEVTSIFLLWTLIYIALWCLRWFVLFNLLSLCSGLWGVGLSFVTV